MLGKFIKTHIFIVVRSVRNPTSWTLFREKPVATEAVATWWKHSAGQFSQVLMVDCQVLLVFRFLSQVHGYRWQIDSGFMSEYLEKKGVRLVWDAACQLRCTCRHLFLRQTYYWCCRNPTVTTWGWYMLVVERDETSIHFELLFGWVFGTQRIPPFESGRGRPRLEDPLRPTQVQDLSEGSVFFS